MRVLKKIVLFFVRELRDWIFGIAGFVGMVTIGEWSGGNWLLGLFVGFIFIGLYLAAVWASSKFLGENEAPDQD